MGGAVHTLLQIQLRSHVRRHDSNLPLRSSLVFLPLRIDRSDPLRCARLLLRVDPIRGEDAEEEVRVLRHPGEGGRERGGVHSRLQEPLGNGVTSVGYQLRHALGVSVQRDASAAAGRSKE